MFRSLFGLGIVLFFLCFVGLSAAADGWIYIEPEVRITISLFVTGLGVAFRYLCLRIRRLEKQVEDLLRRRGQKTND